MDVLTRIAQLVSMLILLRKTVESLQSKGKLVGMDFKLPCISWLYLQLSPNNAYKSTAERYTGVLPFKRMSLGQQEIGQTHMRIGWLG